MSLVWQSITKYMGLCSAPFLVGQDLHDHGSGPVLNVWGGTYCGPDLLMLDRSCPIVEKFGPV
jgi:hypothetical protein